MYGDPSPYMQLTGLTAGLAGAFLPTMIAYGRSHPWPASILVINLAVAAVLFVTFMGLAMIPPDLIVVGSVGALAWWVGALAWSVGPLGPKAAPLPGEPTTVGGYVPPLKHATWHPDSGC
jgi:hypothetical protein